MNLEEKAFLKRSHKRSFVRFLIMYRHKYDSMDIFGSQNSFSK